MTENPYKSGDVAGRVSVSPGVQLNVDLGHLRAHCKATAAVRGDCQFEFDYSVVFTFDDGTQALFPGSSDKLGTSGGWPSTFSDLLTNIGDPH